MITRLKLENFKNFKAAELHLGPFTTLIGSNASGKSNIRDAFRFLHGVGRGYFLAEIMGEKYVEGGVLQWKGIRGGSKEITHHQSSDFTLTVTFVLDHLPEPEVTYTIKVDAGRKYGTPIVLFESLQTRERSVFTYDLDNRRGLDADFFYQMSLFHGDSLADVSGQLPLLPEESPQDDESFNSFSDDVEVTDPKFVRPNQPILTQLRDRSQLRLNNSADRLLVTEIQRALRQMRFFDLSGDALRRPSLPGQTLIGDRGENLSSLLQAISAEPTLKDSLIQWLRELTPMDVVDFDFVPDQTGRILVSLIEQNGQSISAYSASDGTLRFLALLAILLGPEVRSSHRSQKSTSIYFFEELENGLHPARLYLLLQLIEQEIHKNNMQVISTTHSPQFLRFLSDQASQDASLIYRLPESTEGQIQRLRQIGDVERVLNQMDLGRLHESGWFEDAVTFLDDPHPASEPDA